MKLKILLPTQVLLEETVNQVKAEAENGSFGLLPNHIDFVAALVPGLLSFETTAGQEIFVAVDEGILVKCGAEVLVSTRQAVQGRDLESLQQTVEAEFRRLSDREQMSRLALAKLETSFLRGLMAGEE
ncbi:MAG: F0F1 ATP synthase subunit epsilon [Leptolyngbyaceae bacterium]|nr:F0F1 ATP synthase subunit epsilon [Leptolyngbyaceae bacterium]